MIRTNPFVVSLDPVSFSLHVSFPALFFFFLLPKSPSIRKSDLCPGALGSKCRLPSNATASSIRLPPLRGFDTSPFQFALPQVFPCLAQLLLHLRKHVDQDQCVPKLGSSDSQLLFSVLGCHKSASFFHLHNGVLPPQHLYFQILASELRRPRLAGKARCVEPLQCLDAYRTP